MFIEMEGQDMAPDWSTSIMNQLNGLQSSVNEIRSDVSTIKGRLEAQTEAQAEKNTATISDIKEIKRKLETCQEGRHQREARVEALERVYMTKSRTGSEGSDSDPKYNAKLVLFLTGALITLIEILRVAIGKI